MPSLRENFWLWGHPAGAHNGRFGLGGVSTCEPADAAELLGIAHLIMVAFGGEPKPPFGAYAKPLQRLEKLVWSIVGDSSSTRNDTSPDIEAVLELARVQPNLVGAIMDDFFQRPTADQPHRPCARYTVEQLRRFAATLRSGSQPLDLWVVLYDHDLGLPVQDHLAVCDVVTYWTWKARDLPHLETNFAKAQALAPGKRFLQGVYLWDYGDGLPMSIADLEQQCELGLQWISEGRSEGMIFLASCIADMPLETIGWLRGWLHSHSNRPA